MPSLASRAWLCCLIATACVSISGTTIAQTPVAGGEKSWAKEIAAGERFLTELYNPLLHLLPEYEGATVYWLYHDNYLAAKLLDAAQPEMAKQIRSAMKRFGGVYSGKIEILFGEATNAFPFRAYELITVTNVSGNVIRTERVTAHPLKGWEAYSDLLFMGAMVQATASPVEARRHFNQGIALWDGHGFADPAFTKSHVYATYKLGLAALAANATQQPLPFRAEITRKLRALQSTSGGWITDYDARDHPHGVANVETTAIVMLALKRL